MNKIQRQQFFRRIEAKYSLAIQNQDDYDVITEADIFGVLKNNRNIMMLPNSYSISMPPKGVANPWGPTVTFKYQSNTPTQQHWSSNAGDPKLIAQVESQLKTSSLGSYIYSILTKYQGDNAYEVSVTEVG